MANEDENKKDTASVTNSKIGSDKASAKSTGVESQKLNKEEQSGANTDKDKTAEHEANAKESQRVKNISTKMDKKIVDSIVKECEGFKVNEDASKIAEGLYKMLQKEYPKGWCVFVGAHFYGLCTHKDDFCIEFEIDDFRVGCFKTYVLE